MKIVLADDSALIRSSLSKILAKEGYEVLVAEDGQSAIDIIVGNPDVYVAILDWNMPNLTGPEVCEKVRSTTLGRYVYTILLTGQEDMESVVTGLESGADDYVKKSTSSRELCVRVKSGVRVASLHRELNLERNRLSQVMNSLPILCLSINESNQIATWNPECEKVFGIHSHEVVGKALSSLSLSLDVEALELAIENCRTTLLAQHPGRLKCWCTSRNEPRVLDVEVCPMNECQGQRSGVLVLAADITEREQLIEEVQRKNRLESIGHLAAGIAHEVNTPIQYIRDNMLFLENEFEKVATLLRHLSDHFDVDTNSIEASELLTNIRTQCEDLDVQYILAEAPLAISQTLEGAEAVIQIVQSMKRFSHSGATSKVSCNLNEIIESALTVSRNEWKQVATVELDLDQELPDVNAFPGALGQAILNLIVNAAQAMEEEEGLGQLKIISRRDFDNVLVEVQDSGPGIAPEIIDKVFDPFFTTKDVDKGSGQGLALVHSTIVGQHFGSVSVESEQKKGSRFKLRIPIDV